MEPIPFLTIDGQIISLTQFLKHLRMTGGLSRILGEFKRQYFLEKELKSKDNIQVDSLQIEQAILNFRLRSQLVEMNPFREWLKTNEITYEEFQAQIALGLKVEQLKNEIIDPTKIEKHFNEQKPLLQRVVLSRIIVKEQKKAEEIHKEIIANPRQFEQLARENSLTEDKIVNGLMGPLRLGSLPSNLKAVVEKASKSDLIGPIEVDNRYCIFRVEEFLQASLEEGQLKQELQNQLFETWLQEKTANMKVNLEVK